MKHLRSLFALLVAFNSVAIFSQPAINVWNNVQGDLPNVLIRDTGITQFRVSDSDIQMEVDGEGIYKCNYGNWRPELSSASRGLDETGIKARVKLLNCFLSSNNLEGFGLVTPYYDKMFNFIEALKVHISTDLERMYPRGEAYEWRQRDMEQLRSIPTIGAALGAILIEKSRTLILFYHSDYSTDSNVPTKWSVIKFSDLFFNSIPYLGGLYSSVNYRSKPNNLKTNSWGYQHYQ